MRAIDVVEYTPRHPTRRYQTRDVGDIEYLILHHSGTPGGDPWSFAYHHVYNRYFPGIAYHEVIMPDGTRFKTNYDSTISWHAAIMNPHSVGVCLVGNLSVRPPTDEQKYSLLDCMRQYGNAYPIPADHVRGHREDSPTECPGTLVSMTDVRGAYRFMMSL